MSVMLMTQSKDGKVRPKLIESHNFFFKRRGYKHELRRFSKHGEVILHFIFYEYYYFTLI